jgi:hypothetical protein
MNIPVYTQYKKIIRTGVIVLLLLLLFHLAKDWLRPNIIKLLGGYTKREMTTTIDTLSVKYDTLYFKYNKLVTNVDVIVKRDTVTNYLIKWKVKPQNSGSDAPISIPVAYTSFNPINDTLISGTIKTVIDARNCEIVEQNLEYKPKFPILVKEYITIKETVTETLSEEPKVKLGIGADATFNKDFSLFGVYQSKSNWQIQGGYQWNTNTFDSNNIRNTGAIKVGLVKLF